MNGLKSCAYRNILVLGRFEYKMLIQYRYLFIFMLFNEIFLVDRNDVMDFLPIIMAIKFSHFSFLKH